MNKQYLIDMATAFVEESSENYVSRDVAISEKSFGLKMYEAPIFGFASPDDEYFTRFKNPSIIGEHFLHPMEWLPEAKTVISFFLPFSDAVKNSNRLDERWPSEQWLHARIEGQAFINKLCTHLNSELNNQGYRSLVPSMDQRFWASTKFNKDLPEKSFTSAWSERHVAFVCGLGTFGLSKGLITMKGMAGRFASIVTELYLSPNDRVYEAFDEYCTRCGTCIENCPVKAISLEEGKKHTTCGKFVDLTGEKFKPRYACGKCQVGVPCESEIPKINESEGIN